MKKYLIFILQIILTVVYFICFFKILAFIFNGAFSVPTDIIMMFLLLMAGVASIVLGDYTIGKLFP